MEQHSNIIILWQIFAIFAAAKVLGFAFKKVGQPAVIGELIAGAALGPHLLHVFEPEGFISVFSELGVVILLFLAGLETRLEDLKKVGRDAVQVGLLGVAAPFTLGVLGGWIWGLPFLENLFIGTILVATSVGITIRVLAEMKVVDRASARVILGAAVLDDILGLILLSVVRNAASGTVNWVEVGLLAAQAIGFVAFIAWLGPGMVRRRTPHIVRLQPTIRFEAALVLCLGLSLVAEYIGLAAIVGAFMAGLVLAELTDQTDMMEQFEPVGWFLVPFFFAVMGSFIDPRTFLEPSTLALTVFLTAIAVVSKGAGSYLGAIRAGRDTALEVAAGMIPRGEVGIVIAGIGLASKAIGPDVYAASVGMVILTTVMAPWLLKRAFARTCPA